MAQPSRTGRPSRSIRKNYSEDAHDKEFLASLNEHNPKKSKKGSKKSKAKAETKAHEESEGDDDDFDDDFE